MAVDEALLNSFDEESMPILRLYSWETSLSLGRFSAVHRSLKLGSIEAEQIPFVRRISGGGILVHGGDLSYSLILPRKLIKAKGVKESYRHLCRFLIRLYEKLGHHPCFASDLEMESCPADLCLAGREPYDIVIGGRKMGGNAQRHTHRAFLQHGTIPIRINEKRFGPLFLGASGLEDAATLERLGSPVDYEQLAGLLTEAFCETFGADVTADTLRPSEEQSAKELLASKYSQERWNIDAKHDQT